MEGNYPNINAIKEIQRSRQIFKEGLRKKKINENLMQSRIPSNKKSSEEMNLQLNQFHKNYYPKKKGKRCWLCKSWRHLKFNCPKLRYWYCGSKSIPKEDASNMSCTSPSRSSGKSPVH